jgi:hypothetical protein
MSQYLAPKIKTLSQFLLFVLLSYIQILDTACVLFSNERVCDVMLLGIISLIPVDLVVKMTFYKNTL